MSFGWDNVPEIVTIGIYRDVYLESFQNGRLEDIWVRTMSIDEEEATLRLTSRIDSSHREGLSLDYHVSFENRAIMSFARSVLDDADVVDITIPSPCLWWPHTMGKPNLYSLTVFLKHNGTIIDTKEVHFGIRTIEIIEEDQPDDATSFIFSINGKRHFIYGANWQPLDAFTSQVTRDQYQAVLTMARECGFNMIRVWGGGIVEKEDFYALCDRLGIMIWQDFFFACAIYPTDDAFLKTIAQEEEGIIVRLRNHPCIALWCGDNEIDFCFFHLNPENYKDLNRISYEVTGALLERLDGGDRFYLPSSPSSKKGLPDDRKSRNYHNWDCWHHKKSHKSFATEEARFLSEFGRYAAPRYESLRKFVPEGKLWPVDNDTYMAHCGQLSTAPPNLPDYKNNFAALLKEFGEPHNIEEFVSLTQVSQAEFYKFAYEHFRSRKYLCGGGIMWKLADTWPCLENSVIDYWGHPKPALYFLKRVFAPFLAFFRDNGETISLWLSNDSYVPVSARLELQYIDFRGKVLWGLILNETISPDSAKAVHELRLASLPINESTAEALTVRAYDDFGREISRNVHFLKDLNEMRFPAPKVTIDYDGDVARVSTDVYARWVELGNGPYQIWEDNYFDLLPNESRVVKKVIQPPAAPASWKVL
jgi:beta-mannosidase